MPQLAAPATITEATARVRLIMSKLGPNDPITLGNATTGESLPVPPHLAKLIRQVLAGLAAGHQVTISEAATELTPNEAAAFLNVSRMYVMKLVQEGTLPCRMVGNHHRIPTPALAAYKDEQQARSRTAMNDLYAAEHDNGAVDGPPPAKGTYRTEPGRDS